MAVHVLSAGAAKGLVNGLADDFERLTGQPLRCTFGAVGAMQERFDAGDACDVIILSRAMIDELARARRVESASIADIGRVRTGVAVPRDAPWPDVAAAAGLRAALLEASAIYIPDPVRSTAGIHVMKLLGLLGLVEAVQARLRPFPNGATAMAEMARVADARAIGVTQITEILYSPGVQLVAPLPPEFELATVYSAAVSAQAAERAAAAELVRCLTSADSAAARAQGGFEPC